MSRSFDGTYLFQLRSIIKVFTILTKPNLVFQFNSITHFMDLKREKLIKHVGYRCLNDKNPAIKFQ